MARELTPAQLANVELTSTRPIFIGRVRHSPTEELLSSSGLVLYDGESYTAGGFNIDSMSSVGDSATLSLPATVARIAEVQNGTWRGGACQLYAIPGTPDDIGIYDEEDGFLLLDGVIDSSVFSGDRITINVVHRRLNAGNTPRNTLSEVCRHIPPPGTILIAADGSVTLESRR